MSENSSKLYHCKICDFICSKQSGFDRHLLTAKHNKSILLNGKRKKSAAPYMVIEKKEYAKKIKLSSQKMEKNGAFSEKKAPHDNMVLSDFCEEENQESSSQNTKKIGAFSENFGAFSEKFGAFSEKKAPYDNMVLSDFCEEENQELSSQKTGKKAPHDNMVLSDFYEEENQDSSSQNTKKIGAFSEKKAPDDNMVLSIFCEENQELSSQKIEKIGAFSEKKAPDDNMVLSDFCEENEILSSQKKTPIKCQNPEKSFICICGKKYTARNGLWYHKKRCKYVVANNYDEEKEKAINNNDAFLEIVKQNEQFKEMMLEQNLKFEELITNQKSLINNTVNNVNNISNVTNIQNNNFNLNFFLNEQCKNAMNISDFLQTLQVEIDDVANVGKLGYVEGISRIFMKALNNLDVCERPIHCSDLKREVMYVKDNGIWEKEGEDKSSMKKAIQVISHRNVMKIKAWTDANPSWKTHYSKEEDEYLKISYESMGGSTKEEDEKYFNKIIRKVASNVTIDKDKCK